jgi:hypothetical protein
MKPLGALSGVGIMAVAAGILSDRMVPIKIITARWIICIAVHMRVFIPYGRSHCVSALDPSWLVMTEKADDLLTGMILGGVWIIHLIVKPVGPQELGIIHLMGIVTGGALDRVIHTQGFTVKSAHGPNPCRVEWLGSRAGGGRARNGQLSVYTDQSIIVHKRDGVVITKIGAQPTGIPSGRSTPLRDTPKWKWRGHS